MMFATTEDQQLFEATSRRFVETHFPAVRVRELAGEDMTFDQELWRRAAELGWTTLLVPEDAGGGSVSGNGLADLLIVVSLLGAHAAPGPLLATNLVAHALGRWGSPAQQEGALAELLAGDAVATWAHQAEVTASADGDDIVLRGHATGVEAAADASHLLVAAVDEGVSTHHLVPVRSAGVDVRPLRGVDLTRRFHDLQLHDVRLPVTSTVGEPGAAPSQGEHLLDIVSVLAAGEITGAFARSFEMTLEWLENRYSFGRTLSSYQELKHRVADLRTDLEACEAVTADAASAVGAGDPRGRAVASAAMAFAGRRGPEGIQDCIQLHGGIGVTYDHDLHLYLRRATSDANLFGTHRDFTRRLGRLVATTEGATP